MGGPDCDQSTDREWGLNSIGHKNPQNTLATIARLIRLPNLFTAPPDIVVGAALATGAGYANVSVQSIITLAIVSMLLYAGGTTLNDYFDIDEDARERPERPLPAGDLSQSTALVLGIGAILSGVGLAFVAAGLHAGVVASTLALAILVYDSALKGTTAGFLCMGTARGLNILLGITTVTAISPVALPLWVLAVPAVVLIYIASITSMAEHETAGGSLSVSEDRRAVRRGISGTVIAGIGALVLLITRSSLLTVADLVVALSLLVIFFVWTGRPLWNAYIDPAPWTIGPAIGACVTGLIVINASFAATIDTIWALTTLIFIVPTLGLSRVFEVT